MRLASLLALSLTSLAHAISVGTPVEPADRKGQEIMVCGQLYHVGAPVVLWTDPGGYDLTPRRNRPTTKPNEDGNGFRVVRGGDIAYDALRNNVDQFVIHFDAAGLSSVCFKVLKQRRLGVQLMCDIDGTIYQTMDLRNAAPHATIANTRSIGVEVAHIGGAPAEGPMPKNFLAWYSSSNGETRLTIPERLGDGGVRTPNFVGRPARPMPVVGNVQGELQRQYDFTPQQYQSLAQMAATLCTVFPKIQPDFPRQRTALGQPTTGPTTQPAPGDPTTQPSAVADPDEPGVLIPHTLARAQYDHYQGILGHYHIQLDKDDPGVAFQWIPFVSRVRTLMTVEARAINKQFRHQPVIYKSPTTQPTTAPSTEPSDEDDAPEPATRAAG